MVRFNDKPQILDNQITEDDILPITDMDSAENDKKITLGQIKNFVNNGEEKANVDFTNTNMITDSIISAPNGIFEASNNNQAITVKSGLEIAFANGRDDSTGRYAIIEHITSQDITQSVVTLSNNIYELFLTNNDTILFIDTDSIYISEDEPQLEGDNAYWYNLIDNYWKSTTNAGSTWNTANIASLGTIMVQNGSVVSSKPNQLLGIISFEVFKKMTEQEKRPGSLDICDIGMALYVDESKGLRRYLNGSIVDINTNTQAFANKLKQIRNLYPGLFVTEQKWQQIVNNSVVNQCGKFVFDDDANTIRLPKIVMPIQGLTDLSKLGELVDESLPNITGSISNLLAPSDSPTPSFDGALSASYAQSYERAGTQGNLLFKNSISINASNSSSTYQDGTHVQQEQVQYPYFIQIATGQETEADITNEIELNNPYSFGDCKYTEIELNNLSWLRSQGQWNDKIIYPDYYNWILTNANGNVDKFKKVTDTYTDYDWVVDTNNETFRLPIKTNLASGKAVVGNGMTLGMTTGVNNYGLRATGNSENNWLFDTTAYGTSVNTLLHATTTNLLPDPGGSNGYTLGITTDPTKSGIETDTTGLYLYYYVGETVQNANLIDAGRIMENMATKQFAISAGMPSNRYINLELGASGALYIAPANGYFAMYGIFDTTSGYVTFSSKGYMLAQKCPALGSAKTCTCWIPCPKGKGVNVYYNENPLLGSSSYWFRFIYAEGEQ